jgi:hypothetical protein
LRFASAAETGFSMISPRCSDITYYITGLSE